MTTGMPVMLDQLPQLFAGIGRDDTSTAVDDRSLGQFDGGRDLLDLLGLCMWVVAPIARQIHRCIPIGNATAHLDVFGHIDQHRARASRGRDVKSFAHDARDVVDIGDQVVMFGDAATDLDDRASLETRRSR